MITHSFCFNTIIEIKINEGINTNLNINIVLKTGKYSVGYYYRTFYFIISHQ